MNPRSTKRLAVASASLLLLATATACGANSSTTNDPQQATGWTPKLLSWKQAPGPFATPVAGGESYSIDLGNGQKVTFKKDAPLKFIYFAQGQSNTYLQASIKGATDAAKAEGVDLTVVDAQFDAASQRAQIQNAISSKKYNGALILPISSSGACGPVTESGPQAGLPMIVVTQLVCGRDNNSGVDFWAPGSLAYVGGGGGTKPYYDAWAMEIAKSMKDPTKTAVILGPSELAVSHVTVDAMKAASAAYPNMEVVAYSYTDYTDAGGLTATQNVLQAHPDLGAVILQYGGQTSSAIRAIGQAGKADQVGVYEAGGDAKSKQALEDGALTLSSAQSPYSAAYCAVQMLAAVHHGTAVPRVVYNDCNTQSGDATQTKPLILTKQNVSDYIPDY